MRNEEEHGVGTTSPGLPLRPRCVARRRVRKGRGGAGARFHEASRKTRVLFRLVLRFVSHWNTTARVCVDRVGVSGPPIGGKHSTWIVRTDLGRVSMGAHERKVKAKGIGSFRRTRSKERWSYPMGSSKGACAAPPSEGTRLASMPVGKT